VFVVYVDQLVRIVDSKKLLLLRDNMKCVACFISLKLLNDSHIVL
jgi:hypothetical protein